MTQDTAKELQARLAKEALALLMLHPSMDVQMHRTCIAHIGEAWDISDEETETSLALLDQEQALLAAGEPETHVLPESELPMNGTGMETLDNIWDLFETAIHLDCESKRKDLFQMAKWLEESQNLLDWIEKTPAEKQAWTEQAI